MDTNIGETTGIMFASDVCLLGPTQCLATALSLILPFNEAFNPEPNQVGPPSSVHNPGQEPNGGGTDEDPAPIQDLL